MNSIEKASLGELDILKEKTEQMLEKFSEDLSHVLRYWMFEYVVPLEIEGISKFIVLHKRSLELGKSYTFKHRSINGEEEITFTFDALGGAALASHDECKTQDDYRVTKISPSGNNESYIMTIFQEYGHWVVIYKGEKYRQIPLTGDTYSHIISQQKDIEEGTTIDLTDNVITQKDKIVLEIMNLFHDIPEKGALEVCNNYAKNEEKTENESLSEDEKAQQIIDTYPGLTSQERLLLEEIYNNQHSKDSLFKYYERIRYFLHDNKHIFDNRDRMFNHEKIFGELTVRFLPQVMLPHRLPGGEMIRGIDLPSTKALLKEHAERLDFAFTYTKENCFEKMNLQGQQEYPIAYVLRQDLKKELSDQ